MTIIVVKLEAMIIDIIDNWFPFERAVTDGAKRNFHDIKRIR